MTLFFSRLQPVSYRPHCIYLLILITCSVRYSFTIKSQSSRLCTGRNQYVGQLVKSNTNFDRDEKCLIQNDYDRRYKSISRTVIAGQSSEFSYQPESTVGNSNKDDLSTHSRNSGRVGSDGMDSNNDNAVNSDQSNSNIDGNSHSSSMPYLPVKHVAYIVDGNGRWAAKNNKTRIQGHNLGANVTVEIVKESFALNVETVTLYLFSTENWKRSNEEILNIMFLLEKYLRDFSVYLKENNIRVRVIGQRHRLSDSVKMLLKALETSQLFNNDEKAENQRTLCLAVSYGGRDDIIEATKQIAELVSSKQIKSEDITEDYFSKFTMTGLLGIPDPDIIIRTSGEFRISNFLLWQCAYTEFEFVDKLWPEFTVSDLRSIILDYRKRKRRFGGIP